MPKDKRLTQKEAFVVSVGSNHILLPVNQMTLDFVKLIAAAPAYDSMYTSAVGQVYYQYGSIEIKLASVNVFHDANVERQHKAILKFDQDSINATELKEATEG